MIDEHLAEEALTAALERGGEFAELYFERRASMSLNLEDGKLEKISHGLDAGASIRVIRGRSISFVFTEKTDERSLIGAARLAGEAAGGGGGGVQPLAGAEPAVVHKVKTPPDSVVAGEKAELLKAADRAARDRGPEVVQASIGFSDETSQIVIANSDGCLVREERTRVRLTARVVASRNGAYQTGYDSAGGLKGMELFAAGLPPQLGGSAAAKAITMLDSRPAPSGKMAVVLHRGFGGVLFHEACGHGLEADAVEKGASVFAGRVGEQVASPLVTLIDDGSIVNEWGSGSFDDEGVPAQRNILIENGVLKGFMFDRLRARNAGVPPTGNGRRQSFRHPPIPRMTNTFILAGDSTPEEIIASTEHGFFAKTLSGGQVEPATGDFVFGVSEGYLIESGKVSYPLRGATLIGNGLVAMNNVDLVAGDFEMNIGVCGKDGQGVPVGSGQGTLRILNMTVGGTEV